MDTYTVEFRIEDQSLIPSEITNILKLNPCQTIDTIANINSKRKRIPFWAYDGISTENNFIEQDWKSLEEGLLFLLDKLLPKSNLILNLITIKNIFGVLVFKIALIEI